MKFATSNFPPCRPEGRQASRLAGGQVGRDCGRTDGQPIGRRSAWRMAGWFVRELVGGFVGLQDRPSAHRDGAPSWHARCPTPAVTQFAAQTDADGHIGRPVCRTPLRKSAIFNRARVGMVVAYLFCNPGDPRRAERGGSTWHAKTQSATSR